MTDLHIRPGVGQPPYALEITPASAGWGHASLRVLLLKPGATHVFDSGEEELVVLPLAGSCEVRCDGGSFALTGRRDVFSGISDLAYVPRDAAVEISSQSGGRFALAGARCTRRLPARYRAAADVPVESRGAGACSRQVNNFCSADSFEADRLIAVEVLTPAGNWSSYPPHKHDEDRPGEESVLEEIYYFEVDG
ncbi:MAG TPA: 5-deoxy-glucuronate isomerase, partial [Actinomycetes bacterium]|nr:5-deoxy-glucuronate isomerase [Actinomycetes bacterium]